MKMRRVCWLIIMMLLPCLNTMAVTQINPNTTATCLTENQLPVNRPDPDGTPTKVGINHYVINIENIDDLTQTYTVDMVLVLRWQDKRLVIDGKNTPKRCTYSLNNIWHPYLNIFNLRGIETLLPKQVRVSKDGDSSALQNLVSQSEGQGSISIPLRGANSSRSTTNTVSITVNGAGSPIQVAKEVKNQFDLGYLDIEELGVHQVFYLFFYTERKLLYYYNRIRILFFHKDKIRALRALVYLI